MVLLGLFLQAILFFWSLLATFCPLLATFGHFLPTFGHKVGHEKSPKKAQNGSKMGVFGLKMAFFRCF